MGILKGEMKSCRRKRSGRVFNLTKQVSQHLSFRPPTLFFFPNPITDDEIHDVINLEEMTDIEIDLPSLERNLFLDMEATEERYPPKKRVKFDK